MADRSRSSPNRAPGPRSSAACRRGCGRRAPPRARPLRAGYAGLAGHFALAQELKELDPLAQPAAHHLRALQHLGDERGDLLATEIEAPVKGLERIEDLGV